MQLQLRPHVVMVMAAMHLDSIHLDFGALQIIYLLTYWERKRGD